MNTNTIQTTCPYCGVGCGISAQVDSHNRQVQIKGDKNHPANFGRLCSKGSALGETVGLAGRLLQPQCDGQVVSWDTALNRVAQVFADTIAEHGPDAVAIYGSGQLLTEDYYVANKLMKGFIGSGNMDTNSRLCMSSSVAGHKRAFGADTVPGCYEDFEHAELIVFIGSNAAWCHPVSYQRIRAAKVANPALKVVVIDPRRTASCDIADLHLPVASGSDAYLFNGLLHYLHDNNALDLAFIAAHTDGFAAALHASASHSLAQVAELCQVSEDDLRCFYQWFADTRLTMSLYSQGINQSASGTDKVNAIINCHLATGRIGKPGMGPFSLTGQPNAMGGREVGGLAHQLAAHIDFATPVGIDRVARFWQTERIAQQAGLAAVDLFDAIYEGKVKAVWIMGTNPVVSLPNADKVKQALARCPFVVVSDCIAQTDTTAYAQVLLPAQGWSEKNGTVTNSERRISRQRPLFTAAGNAQPDWWIISQVAQRMGFGAAFGYRDASDIFREHAALSGFENNPQHGVRDFDLSGLADLSQHDYDQLQPIQWPVNQAYPNGRARLFADGQFFTANGKAQMLAITPRPPVNRPDEHYPLALNTGRLRDQWHTMTRTALAAKLNQHKPEPFVEVHPADAATYGLSDGSLALLTSAWGDMLARVQVTDSQKLGHVFVPMHWSLQYASRGRMGALVNPAVDPVSKQPESKHTPVRIAAYQPTWQGFILSRHELAVGAADYWVKINGEQFFRYELAGQGVLPDVRSWFADHPAADWQTYEDAGKGNRRVAQLVDNRLLAVSYLSADGTLPERQWLASLFSAPELSPNERKALLVGVPPLGVADVGAIVCACFNVGENTIRTAIKEQGLNTHQAVGACLKAGTNCGSCVPEIKALLA